MEEYIEFPEVITTRLLQQSGAAYNPSDDFKCNSRKKIANLWRWKKYKRLALC